MVKFLDAWAKNRTMTILTLIGLSLVLNAALACVYGKPIPILHDEFSYLLAADTFAHGRLTNPPHPLWEHFETFHELMLPTYMSKYPPAQGFFMALALKAGLPAICGIWLSAALMCAAIAWMLYAFVPPRWAFVGGMIAVLQFGTFSYWVQGYTNATVSALGGSLMLGALPRIMAQRRLRDLGWLGAGLILLLNSRPLEGLLICLPLGILFLARPKKVTAVPGRRWRRIVIAGIVWLMLAVASTCYYNKKVTGEPFLFPQQLYTKLYMNVPLLVWQNLQVPSMLKAKEMMEFQKQWEIPYFLNKKHWDGMRNSVRLDARALFNYFLNYPIGLCGAVFFLLAWKRTIVPARFWVFMMVLLAAIASAYCRVKPHYYAPMTGIFLLIIIQGLRIMATSAIGKQRLGLGVIMALLMVQLIANLIVYQPRDPVRSKGRCVDAPASLPASFTREELTNYLLKKGGKHLVVVRYNPAHNAHTHWEWVFNAADIDAAPIVWARELGPAKDKRLLDYYKDRRVWHVDVFWDRDLFSDRYDTR